MKTKSVLLFAALFSAGTLMSCDNDDLRRSDVPTEVKTAFDQQYPNAKRVEWEKEKGGYIVADFTESKKEVSAWYDSNGVWYLTESDLAFASLPQAVKDAFQASEYAAWRVDDVDKIERKGAETIYVLEIEQGEQEMDLYYNEEGILVKAVPDDDNLYYPQVTPSDVEKFIQEKYPQARIVEIEREKNRIEVDIVHDGKGKEVVFDSGSQWLYTSWDVRVSQLPQAVKDITSTSDYSGYRIDDAEFVESPQGNYYRLELEKGHKEIDVKVDESGTVLA